MDFFIVGDPLAKVSLGGLSSRIAADQHHQHTCVDDDRH
jgi:hypothetical protein